MGAGIAGWLINRATWNERICLAVGGFALIHPGFATNLIGLILIAFVVLIQLVRYRKARKNPGEEAVT
jgi:TRAP-type uncharacterized transport system fused permease subunit